MCKYFSCIVTRNFKVLWLKNSTGHEDIITTNKLNDKKLVDRDFVRIEITPNTTPPTRNQKDWTLRVDEQSTLPEWFTTKQKRAENACWKAWTESVKIQLALDIDVLEVTDTLVVSYGSSRVVSYGSSQVVSYGSSQVESYDSSRVVSYGSSQVESHDSSQVESYGSSRVVSYGSSQVESHDSSQVESHDSSRVVSYGSSQVESHDSSQVEIKSKFATVIQWRTGIIYVSKNSKVQVAPTVDGKEVVQ